MVKRRVSDCVLVEVRLIPNEGLKHFVHDALKEVDNVEVRLIPNEGLKHGQGSGTGHGNVVEVRLIPNEGLKRAVCIAHLDH